MIMIWAIVTAPLIALISYISLFLTAVPGHHHVFPLITLPCYPHSTSPLRFSCLFGTYLALARLMSTRTTLFSTDSLPMYGLKVKYEIHP